MEDGCGWMDEQCRGMDRGCVGWMDGWGLEGGMDGENRWRIEEYVGMDGGVVRWMNGGGKWVEGWTGCVGFEVTGWMEDWREEGYGGDGWMWVWLDG